MSSTKLYIYTYFQTSEFLMTSSDLILAFDATTQTGVHMNVISIHDMQQELVIGIGQLAGKRLITKICKYIKLNV